MPKNKKDIDAVCRGCSKTFKACSRFKVEFCGQTCKERHNRPVVHDRSCSHCGNTFTPASNHHKFLYCSEYCRGSVHWAKRRATKRRATVEDVSPHKVFARDGWRCQACNVRTPKHLRGTIKANAPELDHVQPLSKGGAHSYANTQCLCRRCNSIKGAKPMGQLSLTL